MTAILANLWPYALGLLALIAASLGWRRSIRRGAIAEVKADRARDTILAETMRREIDDDIDQDADLAARARTIPGFMRPDAKP